MVRSLFSLCSVCTAYMGTADDYESYGQPQGEEAEAQKSLLCHYSVSQPWERQGEGFALAGWQ